MLAEQEVYAVFIYPTVASCSGLHTLKSQSSTMTRLSGFAQQVFRQQSESAKIAMQQRRQAGKVKAKEGVITSQLEAEEQAHQRAVAARKVSTASHMSVFHANWFWLKPIL